MGKIIRCLFLGLMLAVFVLVVTDSTVWTKGNIITIGPIDSQAFQALVDSAAPRTTIKCRGGEYLCYQGDPGDNETYPIRITKPLRIVAADENDPPIFMGTGDFEHSPVESGNNCFIVYNLTSDIRGLEFVGLHFEGFCMSLYFRPNYDPANPTVPTEAGVLSKLRVVRCQISDCPRGVQVWGGQTENFEISDNIIDVQGIGVLLYGRATGAVIYNSSRPKNGTVVGNIVCSNQTGIWAVGCENATIRDNFVDSEWVGIWFGDESAMFFPDDGPIRIGSVSRNNVQNAEVGIICVGPTTLNKSLIQDNSISNSSIGILLEEGANRFNVVNNEFYNSYYDIWLGWESGGYAYPPESHDNTVIANDFVTTVVDNGVGNTLVGTLSMIWNPGIPDDIRQKLIELREMLADLMEL